MMSNQGQWMILCCVGSKSSISGDSQDFLSGKTRAGKGLDQLPELEAIASASLCIPPREATHTPILRAPLPQSWVVGSGS